MIWLADCKSGADADAQVLATEDVGDNDDAVLFFCCIVTDRHRLRRLLLHTGTPIEPQPSRRTRGRFVFDGQVFDDVSLSIALLPSERRQVDPSCGRGWRGRLCAKPHLGSEPALLA